MLKLPSYVLITPARNEASFIELTINSVVAQSLRPLKWVIVSDGSTDGTDEIVRKYAEANNWIELIRLPEHRNRDFAAKVSAFNAGLARMDQLKYEVIGSLDADISFGADYFSFLLGKLAENTKLGLVGTPFAENGVTYDYRFASVEHVSGACQVFRRECFGYTPMKFGGIDTVAVLSARMSGWQTRTFPEKTCDHHRKMGSATRSGLAVIFNTGFKDYVLGADPIWEFLRAIYRIPKKPYVIGGATLLLGYLWPLVRGTPRTAPEEIIAFRRQDQRARLRGLLRKFHAPGSGHRAAREAELQERAPGGRS